MEKIDLIYICLVVTGMSLALDNHVECQDVPPQPTVKEFENDIKEDGSYRFRYVLSDGTEREEAGLPEPGGALVVSGYFTYIDPNGKKQYVEYYADKTGYHPKLGIPLPTKVPSVEYAGALPPDIVASLLG